MNYFEHFRLSLKDKQKKNNLGRKFNNSKSLKTLKAFTESSRIHKETKENLSNHKIIFDQGINLLKTILNDFLKGSWLISRLMFYAAIQLGNDSHFLVEISLLCFVMANYLAQFIALSIRGRNVTSVNYTTNETLKSAFLAS